jgi:tetratricopeptide (TPR) repeat protein
MAQRRPSRLILSLLLTTVLLAGAAVISPAQEADELLYGQGVDLYQEKQYEAALELFETLRSSYPDSRKDDDALYYIGRIHRREDRPEQAAEAFRQILSLPSTNRRVEAGYQLGLIHYKNKDYQAAVDLLEPLKKDTDIDHEDEDAVRLLGRSYYNLGILSKNAKENAQAREYFLDAVATFEILVDHSLSDKSRATAMAGIGKSYDKLIDLADDEQEADSYRDLAIQWLERAILLEDEDDAEALKQLLLELRQPKAEPKPRPKSTTSKLKLETLGGTTTLDPRTGLKLSADAGVTVALSDNHSLEIYAQYDRDGFDLKTFNFQDPTVGDSRLILPSDRIEAGSVWRAGGQGAVSSDLAFETAYHFTADPEDTYLKLQVEEDLTFRISDPWKMTLDTTFAWKSYPDYLINGRELDYALAEAAPGVTWYLSNAWRAKLDYIFTLKQYLNAKYDTSVPGVDSDKNRRYLTQTANVELKRRPGAVFRPSAGYRFPFNKSYNYDIRIIDSDAVPRTEFMEGYYDYLEHELSLGLDLHWSDRFQTDLEASAGYRDFQNYLVRDKNDIFTGELRRDWDLKANLEISYLFWQKESNNFADLSLLVQGSYKQAISNMLYEEFFDTNYTSIGAFAGLVVELP